MTESSVRAAVEPWVGMVHVRSRPGLEALGTDVLGGYGNVVALAASEEQYKSMVARSLEEENMLIVEWADILPATVYRERGNMSDYLEYLVENLSAACPVQSHTFYTYDRDD